MSFKGRLICIVILALLLLGCVTCHKFLTCSELISLSIKWRLVVSTSLNNVIYVKHLEERLMHSRCSITVNISYVIISSSYYFKLFRHTHTHTHTHTHARSLLQWTLGHLSFCSIFFLFPGPVQNVTWSFSIFL